MDTCNEAIWEAGKQAFSLEAQALEAASIEDSRRAETLSVAEFVALADAFYEGGLS